MPIRFSATVTRVERVDESLLLLETKASVKYPRVGPGQFFHLAVDSFQAGTHWPESRAFSIAQTSHGGEYRFIISRVGSFVERLWEMTEVGSTIWLKGPYGELDLELEGVPPESDIVFVAAGSGVSPFSSLISERLNTRASNLSSVRLLYSARSVGLLTERDFFRELKIRHKEMFGVEFFVTGDSGGASKEWATLRRIRGEDLISKVRDVASTHVFLSGPSEFVRTFRNQCLSSGMPEGNIHFDDWG